MIHRWLEEWYDTLLYLGLTVGLLCFFLLHWESECQIRMTEAVIDEFLTKASMNGKITKEAYEILIANIDKINSDYDVNVICRKNLLQPVYAPVSEEELFEFYISRNVRKEVLLKEYDIFVEEEPAEGLKLQEETNASVMATTNNEYLPLPDEEIGWKAEAVIPCQEVYEGEELVTVCCVKSSGRAYYAIAEPVQAKKTETVLLELKLQEKRFTIPVEVVCHPRIVQCDKGHQVVNSRKVLEKYKATGRIGCPYCEVIPEYVACNKNVLMKKTGVDLNAEELWILVTYLDGHTEYVTSESPEWQDTYDKNYCGIQQVRIQYRGKETEVLVISENNGCQQCGSECNERYLTDYLIFPYCITCMSKVPLFSGKVVEEEAWIKNEELTEMLLKMGEVPLKMGDYAEVYVSKKSAYVTNIQRKIRKDGKIVAIQ